MEKIRGPVEWVGDDDCPVTGYRTRRKLLAQHDGVGKILADEIDNLPLGSLVHLADEIRPSLGLPDQLLAIASRVADDTGSAPGGSSRGL